MLKRLFAILLPRPQGLIHKGIYFWIGVLLVLPVATPEIVSTHLYLYTWEIFAPISHTGTVLLIGLVFYIIQELLLQQAKFLWNDLRDVDHDSTLEHSKMRYTVQGVISQKSGYIHMIIRWGLALILSAFLSPLFFWVMVIISVHQILYEWVVKPNSEHYPIFFLAFLSFNLPLRLLGAFAALVNIDIILTHSYLLVALGVMYLLSMGSLSSLYFQEAHDIGESSTGAPLPRKHSAYFLQHGQTIAWFTLSGAFCVALIMWLIVDFRHLNIVITVANLGIGLVAARLIASHWFVQHSTWQIMRVGGINLRMVVYGVLLITGTVALVLLLTDPETTWATSYIFTYASFNFFFYLEQ